MNYGSLNSSESNEPDLRGAFSEERAEEMGKRYFCKYTPGHDRVRDV